MWQDREVREFSRDAMAALLANRVPAVRISDFAAPAEREALAEGLLNHARRTNSISQVTRLGISQYEQGLKGSKQHYFDLARQLQREFEGIFADSFAPVPRMINRLRDAGFDAGVMHEPGIGDYFAGCGKLRNGYSPVHVDFSPQDSHGWAIAAARVQLAWNVYLRVPARGGELVVWERQWQSGDDVHQVTGNYYYSDAVVAGARKVEIPVSPGEVLLLNSRNFHAVAEAEDRLAYGSFIGEFPEGRLRFWS